MTRFLDGPAEGVTLLLKRAPFFLRAVQAKDGTWDALDQLTDTPRSDETIAVYQVTAEPGWVHICSRGRNGFGGGRYVTAEYRLASDPPSADVARDATSWREWANTEGPKRGFQP
jgi:hypothetical protein